MPRKPESLQRECTYSTSLRLHARILSPVLHFDFDLLTTLQADYDAIQND